MSNEPNDAFIQHLKDEHGLILSNSDLKALAEYHFRQRNLWAIELANNPDAVFYDIQNGKILGVLAFAAIGFLAAPLLGVGGIVGALMGASIGWRLFGGGKKAETQKESRQTQTYGFDGLSALPSIGGAIPLIYCNRNVNPNGGVRFKGSPVHVHVETSKNTQKIYQLVIFGHREIGYVDTTKTLINGQPIDNFYADEIQQYILAGVASQLPLPGFDYYSQSISPNSNQSMGSDVKSEVYKMVGSAIDLINADGTLDLFSPGVRYRVRNQEFKVISKDFDKGLLITNPTVSVVRGDWISEIWDFVYTSSKKVNQLDIHITGVFWATEQKSEKKPPKDVKKSGVWDLYIDGNNVCRCCIISSSKNNLRRVLKIINLPYAKHKVELRTVDWGRAQFTGYSAYHLDDSGTQVTRYFGNYTVVFEGGQLVDFSQALNPGNKKQWGQQGSAPAQVSSVNEIVYPATLGQPRVVSYPKLSGAGLIAKASSQLQGTPQGEWLVTQGYSKMKVLVWSGSCTQTHPSLLIDQIRGIGLLTNGIIIRNLDRRIQATITGIDYTNSIVVTNPAISWTRGDRWVAWYEGCSNYFPDIYLDTLTNPEGGLGNLIDADFYVDYNSIVDSKYFCIANSFFWDGVIDKPIPWLQWATRESLGSLLFPSKINGSFALLPEVQRSPVGLFNASNVYDFVEEFAERQELNTVIVTYLDGSDGLFKQTSVTIMTDDAYSGSVQIVEETLQLDSVTNFNQAARVGQVYLKTRLLQDRAISFKTGIQACYLQPGDLILVQHQFTEFDKECSGFALESTYNAGGFYIVLLSAETDAGIVPGIYNCACWHLENGYLENSLSAYSVDYSGVIKLHIYGANQAILPPSENRSGDYISIGKNVTQERTYKVNMVNPGSDGSIEVQAVKWTPDMLTTTGLVTV